MSMHINEGKTMMGTNVSGETSDVMHLDVIFVDGQEKKCADPSYVTR